MSFFEPMIAPDKLPQESPERVSLRTQLSQWCKAPSPQAEIMTITPELAVLMLERNLDNNRAQSRHTIRSYEREIIDHRMMLTNQGIGFDANGRLVDGQHRLMACVQSKESFESVVVFGLDPDCFMYVDSGKKRTAADKVGIAGFPERNNLAAAARIVLCHGLVGIQYPPPRSGYLGIMPKGNQKIPETFIVDFLHEHPKFVELRHWYSTYRRFPPITTSLFHALHWLIQEKHPKLANTYIEQICLGESVTRSDNVYRLREHLISLHLSREKVSKAWQATWIIDAFNDTRRGKTTRFLMSDGRDFPKVLS